MKIAFLGALLFMGVFGCALYAYAEVRRPLSVVVVKVGKTAFVAEVADTYIARARGLSGHAPLGVRHAMLFIFPSPSAGAFWMQGMLFSIDFVWIRNGMVMGVTENAHPMAETGYRLYYPPVPIDRVLEVNAGTVKKFGIKIGDRVQ